MVLHGFLRPILSHSSQELFPPSNPSQSLVGWTTWLRQDDGLCQGMTQDTTAPCSLPDHLEALELTHWKTDSTLEIVRFSQPSQLYILRISPSNENPVKISRLKYLERLRLYSSYPPTQLLPDTLSSFAKLPHLRLLSLGVNGGSIEESSTLPLLPNLPPSLTRLDFPRYIPFRPLLSLLETTPSLLIRTLGIGKDTRAIKTVNASGEELAELQEACSAKGIESNTSRTSSSSLSPTLVLIHLTSLRVYSDLLVVYLTCNNSTSFSSFRLFLSHPLLSSHRSYYSLEHLTINRKYNASASSLVSQTSTIGKKRGKSIKNQR